MQTRNVPKAKLAIFETFKTRRNKFTGEAKRQRGIIAHLAMETGPELKTRTSIAHAIAKTQNMLWQNIYSGIFRDLDQVLIPSGVVKEGGRLPLKRGPRALQQQGMPYYELTDAGLLVASSLQELGDSRVKLLERYLEILSNSDPNQKVLKDGILLLLKTAPSFAFKIVNEYIESYSQGTIEELVPMNVKKMRSIVSDTIRVERELVEALSSLSDDKRDALHKFIRTIS
jgi:hypothetical protein